MYQSALRKFQLVIYLIIRICRYIYLDNNLSNCLLVKIRSSVTSMHNNKNICLTHIHKNIDLDILEHTKYIILVHYLEKKVDLRHTVSA